MCNVRGIGHSDKSTDDYQVNLQLLLALQSFKVSLRSVFICSAHNFTELVHSGTSLSIVLCRSRQLSDTVRD